MAIQKNKILISSTNRMLKTVDNIYMCLLKSWKPYCLRTNTTHLTAKYLAGTIIVTPGMKKSVRQFLQVF